MRRVVVIVMAVTALTLGSATAFAAQKSAPRKGSIRRTDFRNFTFQAPGCADYGLGDRPLTTRMGQYEKGAAFFSVNDDAVFGDLDGDGSEEAVVQAWCGLANGEGGSDVLYVYTLNNGAMRLLARLEGKRIEQDFLAFFPRPIWNIKIGSIKVADRTLRFESLAGLPIEEPSDLVQFSYRLEGDTMVLVGQPERRGNTEAANRN